MHSELPLYHLVLVMMGSQNEIQTKLCTHENICVDQHIKYTPVKLPYL